MTEIESRISPNYFIQGQINIVIFFESEIRWFDQMILLHFRTGLSFETRDVYSARKESYIHHNIIFRISYHRRFIEMSKITCDRVFRVYASFCQFEDMLANVYICLSRLFPYTYVHKRIHTHSKIIYIYIYIYMCVCVCVCVCWVWIIWILCICI